MDVVSLCALPASGFEWQPSAGTYLLTVICKATLELRPNVCVLAPEQEPPFDVDSHWNDDPNRSVVVPSDRAPFKPRADVVLVGHAYAPRQQAARSITTRLVVGEIDKSIEVWCNRSARKQPGGQIAEGPRLTQMPLTWERAAGGPESDNPVGLRFDAEPDQYGMVTIPNLQPPGAQVDQWGKTFAPIGYGPMAPQWPSRARRLHPHTMTFPVHGWEDRPLPARFDYNYFNVAPPDQQIEKLRPDERILLENLHPAYERLVTALPGIQPRAIADRATGEREEIALVADTLWIDTNEGICTVVWRGRLALRHSQEAGRVAIWIDELTAESSASAAASHSPEEELESAPDTPRSSNEIEKWPALPFVKSAPVAPPSVGMSAAPPWVAPLTNSKVGKTTGVAVGPGKDPLPFVRGASPALKSEAAAQPAAAQAIVDEDTATRDVGSEPVIPRPDGVLPFQPSAGPALAAFEPGRAQSTSSSRPVDVFSALPFRPPAPMPESPPVSAPVPPVVPFSPGALSQSALSQSAPPQSALSQSAPPQSALPRSAPIVEVAAPSAVISSRKAASTVKRPVDQATIDRHADVKAALWTKGDPRAAVEDVLRELGIDEDEYREGEERLHDALAEEAKAGGSTLARAVRVAVKRAQLVATTPGAKGAGERASSGI
jgi:hypothetical protein